MNFAYLLVLQEYQKTFQEQHGPHRGYKTWSTRSQVGPTSKATVTLWATRTVTSSHCHTTTRAHTHTYCCQQHTARLSTVWSF